MASRQSVAIRQIEVTERLKRLVGGGFELPTQGKDQMLIHVLQLEAIADALEKKAQTVEAEVESSRYVVGVDWVQDADAKPADESPLNALIKMRTEKVADVKPSRRKRAT